MHEIIGMYRNSGSFGALPVSKALLEQLLPDISFSHDSLAKFHG